MKLTYLALKKILPELNKSVINPSRIIQIFDRRRIIFREVPMDDFGCYVHKDGQDYVFLRSAMHQLLYHETICYEGAHAFVHFPAPFLLWRHNLESEVMSLVCMMPAKELPRLNRIKHHLEAESYELLKKRNLAKKRWGI